MNEKAKKSISPRLENMIKGLFMVLFSVVLGINVGKVARTLVFPILYLFGSYYYILISLIGVKGLYRIFMGKKLKIKSALIFFGLI